MNENEEKLRVIAEDCKAVIEEAKSMGCNKVRALYNIPLENMELIVQALEKQIAKKVDKTEITLSKRKFATEIKQLVHQKCIEINHYVSGCNSPFNYLQIADVQESLREIENTLNIKVKE